jgi:hypothetical protein
MLVLQVADPLPDCKFGKMRPTALMCLLITIAKNRLAQAVCKWQRCAQG